MVSSVRYEDPGAVEGLAEALDSRLQVTAGVCMPYFGSTFSSYSFFSKTSLLACFRKGATSKQRPSERHWQMVGVRHGKGGTDDVQRVWQHNTTVCFQSRRISPRSVKECPVKVCLAANINFCAQILLYAQHLSSSEFDKFLEDRVKAVERSGQTLCSVPASTARPPPSSAQQQGTPHDQLFSLWVWNKNNASEKVSNLQISSEGISHCSDWKCCISFL